jgi:hypothetical protein
MKKRQAYEGHMEPKYIRQEYPTDGVRIPYLQKLQTPGSSSDTDIWYNCENIGENSSRKQMSVGWTKN